MNESKLSTSQSSMEVRCAMHGYEKYGLESTTKCGPVQYEMMGKKRIQFAFLLP